MDTTKLLNWVQVLWLLVLVIITISLLTSAARAIDNPDAPNFIGQFEAREKVLLKALNRPDRGSREQLLAYDNYQKFLDEELNKAYQLIKSKLPTDRQQELTASQRNWLAFRDAEFEFINNNWNRQNFGSSAGISRGDYRSTVIRNRVMQLLQYARNY